MSTHIPEQDIRDAMAGNTPALTRLIEATKNTISSIALSIVKDLDASEEVTQQVYIQCWQKLDTLKQPSSFLPWLRQSTRYAAFNYLRDNKISDRIGGEEADALFARFSEDDGGEEASLSRSQQAKILARVIDELPVETREIVLLYYREEQSSQQVASLLSISDSAVRQQLSRARQVLKGKLIDKCGAVILATAPTMSITAILAAGSGFSAPAHAASSSFAKGGIPGLFKALFSGAVIAAMVGALAVFLSAELPLRRMKNVDSKKVLKSLRNQSMVGMLIAGVLMTIAYEFTNGWLAPLLAFELLMAVLFVQTQKMQKVIAAEQVERGVRTSRTVFGYCSDALNLYGGIIVGNLALIYGLYSSGRPFW